MESLKHNVVGLYFSTEEQKIDEKLKVLYELKKVEGFEIIFVCNFEKLARYEKIPWLALRFDE